MLSSRGSSSVSPSLALNGQVRKAKRDHSDEIGEHIGECVNNFVADC